MSESPHPRSHEEGLPEIPAALLRDLRAMPRVSAPLDFRQHLQQHIDESENTLSWWKRLLSWKPGWGFGIPGYAYGAVAAAFVAVIAVYVFNTTDFERDLQQEQQELYRTTDPEQKVPDHQEELPAEADEQPLPLEDERAAGRDIPAPQETPAGRRSETAPSTPETRQPSVRDAAPSTVQPPAPVKQSARPTDDAIQDGGDASKEYFLPTLRGIMKEEPLPALPDSLARKDSLRLLDSIQLQNKDATTPVPKIDPR
ncbi:MAG: hypothetical protein JXA28_15400 [Bacteroidetes bacterium]|nr:hypothetical protein [Bacteroidota bacterium]